MKSFDACLTEDIVLTSAQTLTWEDVVLCLPKIYGGFPAQLATELSEGKMPTCLKMLEYEKYTAKLIASQHSFCSN